MDFAAKFEQGLPYRDFLAKYGNDEQIARWNAFHSLVQLTAAQQELLAGFKREMNVLVDGKDADGVCKSIAEAVSGPCFQAGLVVNDPPNARFESTANVLSLSNKPSRWFRWAC